MTPRTPQHPVHFIPVYGRHVVCTTPAGEPCGSATYEEMAEALAELIWNRAPSGFTFALMEGLERRDKGRLKVSYRKTAEWIEERRQKNQPKP